MKNYKLLQNRPELTNEQIKAGMDFNKIKNNAALATSSLLKSIFIKGLLGVLTISAAIGIYKYYSGSAEEKSTDSVANPKTTIYQSENKISPVEIGESADKNQHPVTEHPASVQSAKVASSIERDTAIVPSSKINTREIQKHAQVNTSLYSGGYSYPDTKEINGTSTTDLSPFITTLGKAELKEIDKSLAKINDRLFASKYEVSNKLYSTFLNALKSSANAKGISAAEIDTLRWRDPSFYNEPYVQYYHTHPAYHNYPVVNISYEGASLFCEWLTAQYNANPKREIKKIRFRLPSEKEWIQAAQAGDSSAVYPWKGQEIRNKKGQILANFKRDLKGELLVNGKHEGFGDVTAPVSSYSENNYGLYNTSGNVAEMINQKGVAKGGSWKDIAENLKVHAKYNYNGGAQPFIGFRYFAEILE